MRIISGLHRGRHIQAPKNLPVRPTTDYAKSGLFNILAHRYAFKKLRVADLFAGTGSITYEFLSRGCENITAVDKHPGCVRFIRDTLHLLGAGTGVQAIQADALTWLKRHPGTFDIILADAPFAETPANELTDIVLGRDLLAKNGVLIIEHARHSDLSSLPGFSEMRQYSNVCFSFFKKEVPADVG
ncbi:MAG: RsmD family RNA methyltransferase [Bacteroidia bacterium]|nr:RsmD family RNA methyltransferase [Bacteroidia bacterium]